MVQVDVFWAYGWGASLAAAAGKPLLNRDRPFESKYFVGALLFLSLIWAPTGMLLLLRHPSWETMQAAEKLSSLSEWLILAFGVTNVTQGILGFFVGLKLLERGEDYLAQLNWLLGYFGMFFILLYGWDGLGYDRFLYDRDMFVGSPAWTPGIATASGALGAFFRFLGSSVARTLYIDGAYLLPPFFLLLITWNHEARKSRPGRLSSDLPSGARLVRTYLGACLGFGLGSAAVCALCVRGVAYLLGVGDHVERALLQVPAQTGRHVLSYFLGLPLGIGLLWIAVLRPGGILSRYLRPLLPEA
jgi:hypothetical protein